MTGAFLLTPCHGCGFVIEDMTEMTGGTRKPSIGSLMICIACGAISIVDDGALGLYMRPPTPDEHRRALADADVVRALSARAMLQRRTVEAGEPWPPT